MMGMMLFHAETGSLASSCDFHSTQAHHYTVGYHAVGRCACRLTEFDLCRAATYHSQMEADPSLSFTSPLPCCCWKQDRCASSGKGRRSGGRVPAARDAKMPASKPIIG